MVVGSCRSGVPWPGRVGRVWFSVAGEGGPGVVQRGWGGVACRAAGSCLVSWMVVIAGMSGGMSAPLRPPVLRLPPSVLRSVMNQAGVQERLDGDDGVSGSGGVVSGQEYGVQGG